MDKMNLIALGIIILIEIVLFYIEQRNKLMFKGKKQLRILVPAMVLAFIVIIFASSEFKSSDIITAVVICPLAFIGNKCGINEEGVLLNCYLTPWDKISQFDIQKFKDRYVFEYRSNAGVRRMFFDKDKGEELDQYLSHNRKIRHKRK